MYVCMKPAADVAGRQPHDYSLVRSMHGRIVNRRQRHSLTNMDGRLTKKLGVNQLRTVSE